jgi:hypothetical protein
MLRRRFEESTLTYLLKFNGSFPPGCLGTFGLGLVGLGAFVGLFRDHGGFFPIDLSFDAIIYPKINYQSIFRYRHT